MFDSLVKSANARRAAFVIAIARVLVALAIALVPRRPPMLSIQETVDLGICDIGAHRFELPVANDGGQILRVGQIAMNSSCRCDAAEVPVALLPQTIGRLIGSIRIRAGEGSTQLVIYSNDPRGPHSVQVR